MIENPPKGMPRVSSLIVYEDVATALEWLAKTFGFQERMRLDGPNGKVVHGELEFRGGVVMLGIAGETPDSKTPKALGGASQTLYVYVDDVDAHHSHARARGATIVAPPQTQFWGDRTYTARDPEGHRWLFAQHVKDFDPQAMGQPGA